MYMFFSDSFREYSWSDAIPDDDAAAGAAAEASPAASSSKKRGADAEDERSFKKPKAGVYIPRGFEFVPIRDWNLLLWEMELCLRSCANQP